MLQELHILPSQFIEMSMEEKAFIIASITARIEKEKAETRKMKKK